MADKTLKSLNFGGADNYFPLPLVTAADNDKILSVVNGEWVAVEAPSSGPSSGQYVWSKQETENGKILGYVVGETESDYPDGGWSDGAYYKLFTASFVAGGISDWVQSNISSGKFSSVYHGNGIWVGCAMSNNMGLYYSIDGKTWTQSNITSGNFYNIFYSNGIWVASSDSGKGLYYSTDGITWTQSNVTSAYPGFVYYANGLWVTSMYYSVDGMTWTATNITNKGFGFICYYNGKFVATTSSGLYYSTNGKTWTQSNITSGTFNYGSVCYGNGLWVACGTSGVYYSTDGMTWTQSNSDYAFSVYFSDGIWVYGSFANGGLYYSSDGKTWTKGTGPGSTQMKYVTKIVGIWIACSYSGIYYSFDGKTWTLSNGINQIVTDVYYANGIFVSATSGSGLYYSDAQGVNICLKNY